MKSEFAFINRIRAQAARHQRASADLICGIGDDAAVLDEREGRETLITTDLLVENIDFKLSYTPPRCLGHKSLAVSLSDIAAMGGQPHYALLTLGIPRSTTLSVMCLPQSDEFWEEFFAGYFALAERFRVALIGGDISATLDQLTIDSMVIGHCPRGAAVRRSGARVGDGIYVTGELGGSAVGLELLRRGERMSEGVDGLAQRALLRHLMPEPRTAFAQQLGERGLVRAMIDVSDGLAQDLLHLCEESRVGAIIDFEAVPVAPEVRLVAESKETAFALAGGGGEDFELLLTASHEAEAALAEISASCQLRLTRIGEIVGFDETRLEPQLQVRQDGKLRPLVAPGYDHFAD